MAIHIKVVCTKISKLAPWKCSSARIRTTTHGRPQGGQNGHFPSPGNGN